MLFLIFLFIHVKFQCRTKINSNNFSQILFVMTFRKWLSFVGCIQPNIAYNPMFVGVWKLLKVRRKGITNNFWLEIKMNVIVFFFLFFFVFFFLLQQIFPIGWLPSFYFWHLINILADCFPIFSFCLHNSNYEVLLFYVFFGIIWDFFILKILSWVFQLFI